MMKTDFSNKAIDNIWARVYHISMILPPARKKYIMNIEIIFIWESYLFVCVCKCVRSVVGLIGGSSCVR